MNKNIKSWTKEQIKTLEDQVEQIDEEVNNIDKNIKEYKVTELYNKDKTNKVIKKNIEYKLKKGEYDEFNILTISGSFNGTFYCTRYEYNDKYVIGFYTLGTINVFGEDYGEPMGHVDNFDDFTDEELKKIIVAIGEAEAFCVAHVLMSEELIKRIYKKKVKK